MKEICNYQHQIKYTYESDIHTNLHLGGVEVDECLDLVVRAHAFNKETIVGEVIIYYFSEFF